MSSTNLQDLRKILKVLVRRVIQKGDITRTMVYWKTVYIQPEPLPNCGYISLYSCRWKYVKPAGPMNADKLWEV